MKRFLFILSVLTLAITVSGCKSKNETVNARIMDNKERIIEILRSTGRPEIESVISHLDTSDFFTRGAGNHHTEPGGLAQHSLEVYRIMRCVAWFQRSDSIIITAILHDMGKIDGEGWHPWRSVKYLGEWGFKLTNKEYYAIFYQHKAGWKYYRSSPLRRSLTFSDLISAAWWKLWHKSPKNIDVE